ncbi:hypothetical protein PDE_07958 [Penicillium oxalicum 114-2]|uniref:Uncharacterized protein n=1 Tax=Penicillium oxalicum (strain 114-2 / CGMCC 5302) TaxID=933388 RepID=S8BDD5_PENO1|nr:hypothetical protein PDE_07958 [Penicillium oxalicum 114-2]
MDLHGLADHENTTFEQVDIASEFLTPARPSTTGARSSIWEWAPPPIWESRWASLYVHSRPLKGPWPKSRIRLYICMYFVLVPVGHWGQSHSLFYHGSSQDVHVAGGRAGMVTAHLGISTIYTSTRTHEIGGTFPEPEYGMIHIDRLWHAVRSLINMHYVPIYGHLTSSRMGGETIDAREAFDLVLSPSFAQNRTIYSHAYHGYHVLEKMVRLS